jgi:hypothetical protein
MRVSLLLAALLVPTIASATQVRAMDLAELAADSEVVVWGKVIGQVSEPIPETPKRYHTLVTVSVLRTLRSGAPAAGAATAAGSKTVVFELAGGTVGRYAQRIAGTPAVAVGDEVVVMLGHSAAGRLQVTGFNQGFWRVTRGPFGPTVAMSDRRGAELLQQGPLGGQRGTAIPVVDVRPLDALLADLTAALTKDAP